MDKRDVLETDIRVTVLGKKGKYTFDWVDKEKRIVEYNIDDSDFSNYTDEVEDLLLQQGMYIDKDDDEDNRNEIEEDTQETNGEPERYEDNSFDPVSVDDQNQSVNESENNNSSSRNLNSSNSDSNEEKNNENNLNNTAEDDGEIFSFIVRMSDAKSRREVIDQIRDTYPNSSDKLELTGPYEVEYKITNNDEIKLINVTDLGLNQDTQ